MLRISTFLHSVLKMAEVQGNALRARIIANAWIRNLLNALDVSRRVRMTECRRCNMLVRPICAARPMGMVAAACIFIVAGCSSGENASNPDETFRFSGGETVLLPELLNPAYSGYVLEGVRLFTLDTRKKQVLVFSDTGKFVRAIGRDGRGPGEFMRPSNLDIIDDRLAVSQFSGRVSLFDTSGTFLNSFVAVGVSHANGNVRILNDSLLVMTGYRAGEEIYTGTMAHIYTVEGILVRDFLWLSSTAKEFEATSLAGAICDRDWDTESFWCVQSQEYIIYHYDLSGSLLDSLRIAPPHYRPLSSKEPSVQSDDYVPWMQSWDWVTDIRVVDNDLLMVTLTTGTGHIKSDLIDTGDGSVLTTYNFGLGGQRLVAVDPDSRRIALRTRVASDDPITTLVVLPVSALEGD